jgi:hypothetical protein
MSHTLTLNSVAVAVAVSLFSTGAFAADCPRIGDNAGEIGTSITCECSAADTRTGTVWGSTFYTSDSNVCRAGLHAGMITEKGGQLTFTMRAGQPWYTGTRAFGVTTSSYGAYGQSFTFGAPLDRMPSCPANAEKIDTELTCGCSAADTEYGTVWGSGVYTSDSAICKAARHAGAIGASGGEVTLVMRAGRTSYSGSDRNGVSTKKWDTSWPGSFVFR